MVKLCQCRKLYIIGRMQEIKGLGRKRKSRISSPVGHARAISFTLIIFNSSKDAMGVSVRENDLKSNPRKLAKERK